MSDKSSPGPRKSRPDSGRTKPRRGPGKPSGGRPPATPKSGPPRRSPAQGRPRGNVRRPQSLKSKRQQKRLYHLIVNQTAGNNPENSVKLAKKLERSLKRSGHDAVLHSAVTWDEYVQEVINALRDRPFAVVIFGGDGSVRMAASRIARAKGLLGIVPCGRFNDIFRSLYGHANGEEALEIVRSDHQMRIDAALANGQFFLGSLITGLLPNLIERLDSGKLPRLTLTLSKMAARAADDTIPRTATFKVDSYTFKAQPLVLNFHLLSHLMTLRFAPVAAPGHGRVILIYDEGGTRDKVAHYIRDLKKDRYQYTENFHMLRGQRISVSPAMGRTWLMDGDKIEFTGEEIGIEVLPQILRVFSNAPTSE